jgi:hypothetical protein
LAQHRKHRHRHGGGRHACGDVPAYRIERWIVMFVGITTYHLTQVYFYSPQTRSTVKYECSEQWRDLQGNYTLQEKAEVELTNFKIE